MPPMEKRKERDEGKTLIKQFLLIIMVFYFYVELRNLHVTLVRNDLTQQPLPQWHIVACFCHYSMSLFIMFHNAIYLPVEIIIITVVHFRHCFFFFFYQISFRLFFI